MLKELIKKLISAKNSVPNENTKTSKTENNLDMSTKLVDSPKRETFEFNVAGVTSENEKKKDIQKLLRSNGKRYAKENNIDLYAGLTNREIIESYIDNIGEFEDIWFTEDEVSFVYDTSNIYDSNAIKIYIKYYEDQEPIHIGYVPKKDNLKLKSILDKNEGNLSLGAKYVGGKIKSVTFDEDDIYEDKGSVLINEITLGINITVFYDKTSIVTQ